MIEIKIPQEINKYEAKTVGRFTTRQTICLVIVALLSVGLWNLLKGALDVNTRIGICLVVAVPFALAGWYKPYGMHFERFFIAVLFNTIISSTKRIFKSTDMVSKIESEFTTPAVKELAEGRKKAAQKKNNKPKKVDPKKYQSRYQKYTFK